MKVMWIVIAFVALGVSFFVIRETTKIIRRRLTDLFLIGRGFVLWGTTLTLISALFGSLAFLAGWAGIGWFISILPRELAEIYPASFPSLTGMVFTIAAILGTVFWWTMAIGKIPIGSLGQVLFFGQRLDKMVVEEGLRALPLPPPFFGLQVEDVRENSIQLFEDEKGEDGRRKSNIVVLTKDGVKTTWYATLQYAVVEPAKFLSTTKSVIEKGLVGSTVEAFRRFTLRFSTNSLIEGLSSLTWDPNVHKDMTEKRFKEMEEAERRTLTLIPMNDLLIREVEEEMEDDAERWGIKIKKVIPGNVRFPAEVETAFSKKVIEDQETEADEREIKNLFDRSKKLMELDPNMSASEATLIVGDERGKASSRRRIAIDGAGNDPLTRAAATVGAFLGDRFREGPNRNSSPPESPEGNRNERPKGPGRK